MSKRGTPEWRAYETKRDRAVDLVRSGATYAEAANATGFLVEAVHSWCKTRRVTLTAEARRRAKTPAKARDPHEAIRALHRARAAEFRADLEAHEIVALVAGELELTVAEVREALA